jgi:hypothetical protein
MAKKTRKCGYCKIDDTNKEYMVAEASGKKKITYKYYHKNCHTRFLKQKAFKEKERRELDDLVNTIMEIYGVKVLHNSVYPLLQDLRNGNKFFGKKDYKYKEGYSYKLIEETFRFCSDSIERANSQKNFSGFTHAFRYGLAIVCDKLMVVEAKQRHDAQAEKMIEAHASKIKPTGKEFETSYKPKENKNDITEFLDD